MLVETFDEPVEVIFYFTGTKGRPIRFRREGKVTKIASTNGYWMRRVGTVPLHYWAVSDKDGVYYELEMNGDTLGWKLVKIVSGID